MGRFEHPAGVRRAISNAQARTRLTLGPTSIDDDVIFEDGFEQ